MVHSLKSKIHQPHLSTAQDARAVRTREALRCAMLELLEAKPLDQITIREISAVAGVGYTTFFRHHPTKESLLDDVAAGQMQHLIALAVSALDLGGTRASSRALFGYVDEHRALWSTLLTGGAAGTLRNEFLRTSRTVAAERAQSHDWIPAEVAAIVVMSSTFELLDWWLRQKEPLGIEQVAEIYDHLVVAPTINSAETRAQT